MNKIREVVVYKSYFDDFFSKQPQNIRDKIIKVLEVQTLEQIKERYYGKKGTEERNRIERELEALRIGFQIRNAREKKEMTQTELAD
jgi:ribosome-binding protein aMBF1 (putative translation factor)